MASPIPFRSPPINMRRATVAPGASCSIAINFSPQAAGLLTEQCRHGSIGRSSTGRQAVCSPNAGRMTAQTVSKLTLDLDDSATSRNSLEYLLGIKL